GCASFDGICLQTRWMNIYNCLFLRSRLSSLSRAHHFVFAHLDFLESSLLRILIFFCASPSSSHASASCKCFLSQFRLHVFLFLPIIISLTRIPFSFCASAVPSFITPF